MNNLASQVLDVEIDLRVIQGARWDEIHNIVKSHQVIQSARDDFLNGLLTWSEYLDLCEMHEMNMDSYLNTVDNNLQQIGIIV